MIRGRYHQKTTITMKRPKTTTFLCGAKAAVEINVVVKRKNVV